MRQPALCGTPAAIRILKLERYRAARQSLTAQAASNRLTQQRNRRFDVPALSQIFRKGAFIADRLDLALFIETRDFGDFKSQRTLTHTFAVDAKNRGQGGFRRA